MLNQLKFNQKQIQWILITIMMSQETGLTLGGFVTCTSCITRFFFVGKGVHEPKAQMARAYPSFISMKHLGVLLLPPGQDASASGGNRLRFHNRPSEIIGLPQPIDHRL